MDSDEDEDDMFLDELSDDEDMEAERKDFEILSRDDIIEAQEEHMQKVAEVLDIDSSFSRILLMHFEWDSERLLTLFFDKGKEEVYKVCGVRDPSASKSKMQGEFSCPTCMDDVELSDTTELNCGHRFCNDCWTSYVTIKINEGFSRNIKCMAPKCNIKFDEGLIPQLVDAVCCARYTDSLINSFVEDNPLVKWCPSVPHCGNAVKVNFGSKHAEVQCPCGLNFCFNCGKEAHSPCPCALQDQWEKKLQDDSETVNYLTANTRSCPKCAKLIERESGCNLMTCKCGQYFCWLCGAPTGFDHDWETIKGHSCGKWKEDKSAQIELAQHELTRFMHYYNRYKAHDDTRKLRAKMVRDIEHKIKGLEADIKFDLVWFNRGLYQLFMCRRVLSYSYALAFFLFRHSDTSDAQAKGESVSAPVEYKNLFEDYQEQLEIVTEKLSQLLELPVEKYDEKMLLLIQNLTQLNDKRCKGLFDMIITDLFKNGASMYTIAPYVPTIEGTSSWKVEVNFQPILDADRRSANKA